MRTLLASVCLYLLLLLQLPLDHALRLHGEPLPARMANQMQEPKTRIAGGDLAAEGAWPWIVSIQNQYAYPFCGGAIIGDYWVVTAASCVSGLRARNLLLLAGTLSTWNNSAPGYYVDEIHVHCNFDKPLYHNDIALLHLTEKIEYNQLTAKIPLAELDELNEGERLAFAGWGKGSTTGTNFEYLQQSEGDYVSVDECRRQLGNSDDVDLGHVCVSMQVGKGMCHGDTGGPLINAQGQLVGIGNWGVPCGRGFPDVYNRVAFYNDWIRTTMNGCGKV